MIPEGSFRVDFARILIFTFFMLFVLMYFMYIMYMLCFYILCLYAIYEWPEFYVNKDMFCSVNKDFSHLLITFANSKDPDQGREECYNPK